MSYVRWTLTVLVVLVSALGALPAGADESDAPATIEELESALDRLAARVDRLLQLAERDPRHRIVDEYALYGVTEFASSKRVKAKTLVEIMTDKDAPEDLRVAAFNALKNNQAKALDPDLKEKVGRKEKRKEFGFYNLRKLVKSKDPITRKLGYALLLNYFGGDHKFAGDLLQYNPETATPAQQRKAYNYWSKVLSK